MPPRIVLPVRLWGPNRNLQTGGASSTRFVLRALSCTPAFCATTKEQRRRRQDPYVQAQAAARKAANLSHRAVLEEERQKQLGDPVRGITTPFVQSFDAGSHATAATTTATEERYLNYFLKPNEVDNQLATSARLSAPSRVLEDIPEDVRQQTGWAHSIKSRAQVEQQATTAATAIQRIVSLSNASSQDRTRANVQRCINTFGRHKTDLTLPPKPSAAGQEDVMARIPKEIRDMWTGPKRPLNPDAYGRGGPDTGSSEVQIAILTAKIRTLANFLESRGRKDKVNKRNLRLLVHRRQKLLAYLRKRERGGPRWQNVVETLGLTEGTWKGEISL